MDYSKLQKELRIDILKMINKAKSGHPGGSLSCIDILIALYYEVMNIDPKNPDWEDRDRFILSKGHACPAQYAVLANKGYFDKEELWHLRKIDGALQGHPDFHKTKGIDMNTGSLGQGSSIAMGMALVAKFKKKNYKVYCVIGDGECQEGIVWEASMAASHYKLDNLTYILDYNKLQIDGTNDEVMTIRDIKEKFKAFGFEVFEVDGHDIEALVKVLKIEVKNKPKFICANTIKGKGVDFMENNAGWHGKAPSDEELEKAIRFIGE